MNLHTWAEQQKALLIRAGVNPLDAELAVDWVIEHLPQLQNPDTWVVSQTLFDDLRTDRESVLRDAVAAWAADPSVEVRHQRLLTATPATWEQVEEANDAVLLAILAAYWYVTDRGQYYSRKPLRAVTQRTLRRQFESFLAQAEDDLEELARLFAQGDIRPSVWQSMMRQRLRRLHVTFRALGSGGISRLTGSDFLAMNRILAEESARLQAMAQMVLNGELSSLQAMDRARWYAGTAAEQYWRGVEMNLPSRPGEQNIERNILRPAEHCDTCVRLTDMGWQRPGIIPPPKVDRDCGRGCKCYKIYHSVPVIEVANWIGTQRTV